MTFRLLSLPDLAFLEVIKEMNPIHIVYLNMAFGKHMQRMMKKYVSLGTVIISIDPKFASLTCGKFTWFFSTRKHWEEKTEVNHFLPLPYTAVEDTELDNKYWKTKIENPTEAVTQLYDFLMTAFPRTRVSDFLLFHPKTADVQLLNAIPLKTFKTGRIVVQNGVDAVTDNFFKENLQNRDVLLVCFVGNKYNQVYLKNLRKNEVLALERKHYLKNHILLDRQCEYIVLSGLGIHEAHIESIVQNWITGVTNNLIFVHVKSIKNMNLNIRRILGKTRAEQWDDDEMMEFERLSQFTSYFNEKGVVIRNKNNKVASIHINQEADTFSIVVWSTDPNHRSLSLYQSLPLE